MLTTRTFRVFASILLVLVMILPARAAEPQYFPETQHNLLDPMASYWQQHGGLPVFGYPISEAFSEVNADTGQAYLTQYFERNRLESHPENAAPYHILLGLLGKEALAAQGRDWTTFPKADPSADHYFEATGHAIAHEPFWTYFRAHGLEFDGRAGYSLDESIALFGLPLSEPIMETNSSGDTVLTQWFERARFEHHPNNPADYQVLLGLLGNEVTGHRSGEAPFQASTPMDEIHAAAMQLFDIFNTRRVNEVGKPAVEYRHDIQAEADAIAKEWYETRAAGGDSRAVLEGSLERLAQYGTLKAVYATANAPLEAGCQNIDPAQPIASAYSPAVASYDFRTLTLGVYGPYGATCGRAITVVYIIGY